MIDIGQRTTNKDTPDEFYRRLSDKIKNDIRVAMPGIIQSFDPAEQTVTVQPAIRERIRDKDGNLSHVNLPLLVDVPVHWPRAGGLVLTFPIQPGDECLLIFGDMCMDAHWSNGGIQNQAEKRRHDLSDAYALVGLTSQHAPIANYSTTAAELRTESGAVKISVSASGVNITGGLTIDGVVFGSHEHGGVMTGGGKTGGPVNPPPS